MAEIPVIEIREPGHPVRRILVDRAVEIGRGNEGVPLDDPGVSRRHLKLTPSPLGLSAVDMGSRNGSLLNGLPLERRQIVEPGDVIRVGATDILVVRQHAASSGVRPVRATRPYPSVNLHHAALPAPPPAPVVGHDSEPDDGRADPTVHRRAHPRGSAGLPDVHGSARGTCRVVSGTPCDWSACLPTWRCASRCSSGRPRRCSPSSRSSFRCLPILFFVAPGLWRNICPLAAANQAARVFGFSRAGTTPGWLQRRGYLVAIALFFGIAGARLVLFNANGTGDRRPAGRHDRERLHHGRRVQGQERLVLEHLPAAAAAAGLRADPVRDGRQHPLPARASAAPRTATTSSREPAYQADLVDPDPAWSRPRRLFAAALPGLRPRLLPARSGHTGRRRLAALRPASRCSCSSASGCSSCSIAPARRRRSRSLIAVWGAIAIMHLLLVRRRRSGRLRSTRSVRPRRDRDPLADPGRRRRSLRVIWFVRTVRPGARYLRRDRRRRQPGTGAALDLVDQAIAAATAHGGCRARAPRSRSASARRRSGRRRGRA